VLAVEVMPSPKKGMAWTPARLRLTSALDTGHREERAAS